MIVYKIGLSNYLDSNGELIDKNSGVYEYKLILNSLANIDVEDSIVVINGKRDGDTEQLLNILKKFKNIIFVASDPIAFTENKDIAKMSTHILHQCPMSRLELPDSIDQRYSYVPELFYKNKPNAASKTNDVLFGGGVRDNEEKIDTYTSLLDMTTFIKRDGKDSRLPYDKYREEISKHKYNLIVARKWYEKIGWITARYFETLAANTLPLVDEKYDRYNYLNCIKVNKYTVESFISCMNLHEELYNELLSSYQSQVYENGFYETIKDIVGG